MIVDNLGELWYNESGYGSIGLVIFREEVALCISLMTLIILQINRVDAMTIVGVIVGDATLALVTIIPKETLNNSSAAEQRISPQPCSLKSGKDIQYSRTFQTFVCGKIFCCQLFPHYSELP